MQRSRLLLGQRIIGCYCHLILDVQSRFSDFLHLISIYQSLNINVLVILPQQQVLML